MATVNFLYRSIRKEALLTLRLLYAHNGKNFTIAEKTQKLVSKEYWDNVHFKQRISDIEQRNLQKEIREHNTELETHILDAFVKVDDPSTLTKEWLREVIQEYYNPTLEKLTAPEKLTDFFLFYADLKANDLSQTRQKRLTVVRNKLLRFEEHAGEKIFIPNVNDIFKRDFLNYGKAENYAHNTLKSDLSVIKTVCTYASQWNIKTSPQLENLKISDKEVKSVYLSFDELTTIAEKEFPANSYLDNARDWLIVSCYTGQRISDFLRFTPEMVTKKKGKYFLEFVQQKTKTRITIPFLKEAKAIFDKHGGNFPRPISHQRYNDYIKEVCKEVGINEPTKGGVLKCIADDPKKATRNDYRRTLKTVPKYELVSSHIGRRSFATNYYGDVPTNYLIKITGHSTEKMFLNYIQKNEKETAFDAFKYFE